MDLATVALKVALALIVTLAFVIGAAVLARRFGVNGIRANDAIRILSVASLGTRERLLLVQVHGRQLLLGVTAQQVTPVHVFGDDVPPVPAEAPPDFRSALSSLMAKRS
jgi:flagellar protein FliO/FliZ